MASRSSTNDGVLSRQRLPETPSKGVLGDTTGLTLAIRDNRAYVVSSLRTVLQGDRGTAQPAPMLMARWINCVKLVNSVDNHEM